MGPCPHTLSSPGPLPGMLALCSGVSLHWAPCHPPCRAHSGQHYKPLDWTGISPLGISAGRAGGESVGSRVRWGAIRREVEVETDVGPSPVGGGSGAGAPARAGGQLQCLWAGWHHQVLKGLRIGPHAVTLTPVTEERLDPPCPPRADFPGSQPPPGPPVSVPAASPAAPCFAWWDPPGGTCPHLLPSRLPHPLT